MRKKIIRKISVSAARGIIKAKRRLLNACTQNKEVLFALYKNNFSGFGEERVLKMRAKYGLNEISHKEGPSVFRRVYGAFVNPFTVVLFALALISFATDVLMMPQGSRDYSAVIIISALVFISGALRFVQEVRSDKSAQKLKDMVKTTIMAQRRETGKSEIAITELVVGDIIYLSAGDMIPADARVLYAKDLFVSQSSLTGESEPVEKLAASLKRISHNPLDYNNLVFMGSNVISGSAAAMVMAVGDTTVFGSIAQELSGKKKPTSFETGVNSVSWVLIRFMLVMVPVVLFINGFTKGDWVEAFMFALSVAVGLTPEMLPMIVTTNLAKGAVSMSKKRVVVKDLNSIQNFGAMDILCTDKTGTITQDKVVLQYSLDIHGVEDDRVLLYAYLNSGYQTGLKNLMDIAIINRAKEKEMDGLAQDYKKIDEIPFDFNRRRMSVVVSGSDEDILITKGAAEEMLSVCSHAEYKGKIEPLTQELKQEILGLASEYNGDGMRVLGLARKVNPAPAGEFSVADESDMIIMGFLAFLDPPKESAAKAIEILSEYGVTVKVLTGDNDAVTKSVCKQVGMKAQTLLLGSDIEDMGAVDLSRAVETCSVFAKLSPRQKSRVVEALRNNGHTVGFMGDGINDAPAMRAADVGISVDSAVDVAKESANIILLEKSLMVLEEGVVEGRKTYANTIKYIKMTASSNFGNMFSVLAASAFLPFLPMLPVQILVLNLIYDLSCIAIPWDNVDAEYLKVPRKWDANSISKFMVWIGPTSSVFDITTYLLMFFLICPMVAGGAFATLTPARQAVFIALFHTGWFVESLWSQTLVVHTLRTPHMPFAQSRASWQLTSLTALGIIIGTVLPYTLVGKGLDMYPLPFIYFPFLVLTLLLYMTLTSYLKKLFIRRYSELL